MLATALETLGFTENRYSGIPTIRRAMNESNLPEPVFSNERGEFAVILYNRKSSYIDCSEDNSVSVQAQLINFCREPRTREEIADFLGLSSKTYAIKTYVTPMVREGRIKLSIPEKPGSSKQKYYI